MSESTTIGESNATAAREFTAAIFDDHDLDAIEEHLSADVVQYTAGQESARGHDGAREYFGAVLGAFPDIDLEIAELVADGDCVMYRFEATGTHEGDLPVMDEHGGMDVVPATGETVSWQGFVSCRFADGEIVEVHLVADQFGMARQLGLLPDAN